MDAAFPRDPRPRRGAPDRRRTPRARIRRGLYPHLPGEDQQLRHCVAAVLLRPLRCRVAELGKVAPRWSGFTRSLSAVRNCETTGPRQTSGPRLTNENKTRTCGGDGGGALGGTRTPNLLIRRSERRVRPVLRNP